VLEVWIVPGDEDSEADEDTDAEAKKVEMTWDVEEFKELEMTIQCYFKQPLSIS